jgi:hypothetical protein
MASRVTTPTVLDPEAEERRWREERKAAEDWARIDRLRDRNADKDPDEVMADATAAVEEVRQEMYEEKLRAAGRRR